MHKAKINWYLSYRKIPENITRAQLKLQTTNFVQKFKLSVGDNMTLFKATLCGFLKQCCVCSKMHCSAQRSSTFQLKIGPVLLGEGCKNKKVKEVVPGPRRGRGSAKIIRGTTSLLGFWIKICTKHNKRTTLRWGGGGQGRSGPGKTFLYFFIFAPFPYNEAFPAWLRLRLY